MLRSRSPIYAFVLAVLVWLPPLYAVWYLAAPYHLAPSVMVVDQVFTWLWPEVIRKIGLVGHQVLVITGLVSGGNQGASLALELTPLQYSYSYVLFAGLVLATPSSSKFERLMFGFLILFVAQLWSLGFDVLKALVFDVGKPFEAHAAFSQYQREIVALGYQFGKLMLPAILPVIIWVGMHQGFLRRLAPQWLAAGQREVPDTQD